MGNSIKCPCCGLINFIGSDQCRRCGDALAGVLPVAANPADDTTAEAEENPHLTLRVIPVLAFLALVFVGWWASLILSSDPLTPAQRVVVDRAVAVLRDRGFDRETFLLTHVTSFRASDNWWNAHVGHGDAYAATNFPFEVMTVYPRFFTVGTDDVERAIILLHEAQHLRGKNEGAALAEVWRVKGRLGWTEARYRNTRVWKNTREWTRAELPALFECGLDLHSDCTESGD